jgi:hypothetical protein
VFHFYFRRQAVQVVADVDTAEIVWGVEAFSCSPVEIQGPMLQNFLRL